MERADIVEHLKTMALALELLGNPPERAQAFRQAAGIVARAGDRAWAEWLSGTAPPSPRLDADVQTCIRQWVQSDTVADLEALLLRIPPGLFGLLKIRGLGPRRVHSLWVKAGVISQRTLERACRREALARIEGFGNPLQAQLLSEIQRRRRSLGRWLRRTAMLLAEERERQLRQASGLSSLTRAGDIRRALETVDEIVWVAAAERPRILLGRLASLEGARLANQDPPDTLLFESPDTPRQRVVVVPPAHLTARLFLETGSASHVRGVLQRLASRSICLAAQGPAAPPSPEAAAGLPGRDGFEDRSLQIWLPRAEEEIYERAGMAYVPPELREDRGEIAAASSRELPKLVEPKDLKGVLHVHTTWSDGKGSVHQMATTAHSLGWSYLGITDHSPAVFYANGLSPERLRQQANHIRSVQEAFTGLRIFHGVECDILPDGTLDLDDRTLARLDYALISIHSLLHMGREAMTQRIIRAMQHPKAIILAHPTGRLLLEREGYALDWDRLFDAAATAGVAMEFNSPPERLDLDWRLIREATRRGILISISPDAHTPGAMGNVIEGIATARKGWLTASQVLNTRTAQELEALFARRGSE
ncbi:MAG: PHP domain-containing protein [Candidatus Eisenbacteria sp.]|nr:PHP domain-containing protein [Candidatus Eisenbacteria bacterium]